MGLQHHGRKNKVVAPTTGSATGDTLDMAIDPVVFEARPGADGRSEMPDPSENARTRGAYVALIGSFCAFVGGLLAAVTFSGRKLPKETPKLGELALIGVAAHNLRA